MSNQTPGTPLDCLSPIAGPVGQFSPLPARCKTERVAFKNPMSGKAKPERMDIWHSVSRGRAVEVRANASDAMSYADWAIRMYRTTAMLAAFVGILNLGIAVASRRWLTLLSVVVFLAIAVFCITRIGRARKSIPSNEALLNTSSPS